MAGKIFPVLVHNIEIRMRTAIITNTKAVKNRGSQLPCGEAEPKKSITGRCQQPHRNPSSREAGKKEYVFLSAGNANPIHPISSRNPAIKPKMKPTGKKLGE
jgi:hypothetical protein